MNNLERAGIEDHGEPYQGRWYARIEGDAVTGVAAHFWNDNILMQCPDRSTLPLLLDALLASSTRRLGGLVGPWSQLEIAATHLNVDLGACHCARREPLFELETGALHPPEGDDTRTRVRQATLADLDELASWRLDFDRLLDPDAKEDAARARMSHAIQEESVWLLEDCATHQRLAMTANNALVQDTFQIGSVWTPEPLRRRGHARRVVAGQIEAMRERGYAHAVLFTAEDNVAAQRAYTSLGFVHTQDYGLILGIPEHGA